MKLLKINLIFVPLLALCLGVVGYAARKMLLKDARQYVLQNARLLMETALSSRNYTIKYITPLILQYDHNAQTGLSEFRKSIEEIPSAPSPEPAHNLYGSLKKGYLLGEQRALDEEKRFLESLERRAEEFRPTGFHPQAVSFFAAIEILTDLLKRNPEYSYREATLNPTNPRDLASDWERYVIDKFRSGAVQNEFVGRFELPSGASLFLAHPMRVDKVGCLECHSTPDKAPPEMVTLYGATHGFGWHVGDIVGAQIVSMPEALPMQMVEGNFRAFAIWLAGAFAGIVLVANASIVIGTRVQSGVSARNGKNAELGI
jgi:Protein of unknown function (DUF3365)